MYFKFNQFCRWRDCVRIIRKRRGSSEIIEHFSISFVNFLQTRRLGCNTKIGFMEVVSVVFFLPKLLMVLIYFRVLRPWMGNFTCAWTRNFQRTLWMQGIVSLARTRCRQEMSKFLFFSFWIKSLCTKSYVIEEYNTIIYSVDPWKICCRMIIIYAKH